MMTKLLQRHTMCPVEGLMSTLVSHKWDGIIETGGVCIMHTAQRAACLHKSKSRGLWRHCEHLSGIK